MKKIFFSQNCFKDGPEAEESLTFWIAYKNEFKDLKDFSRFYLNDDLQRYGLNEIERTELINEALINSNNISIDEFLENVDYREWLKDSSGIILPSKIKDALSMDMDWNNKLHQ